MATIKDIYDADTTGQSRSLNYRFTVDSLDDPLLLSLIELNKKQNKVWRNNCIRSRTISKSVYPHKVVTMSRGPRVAAVKRHLGINKLNDRINVIRIETKRKIDAVNQYSTSELQQFFTDRYRLDKDSIN